MAALEPRASVKAGVLFASPLADNICLFSRCCLIWSVLEGPEASWALGAWKEHTNKHWHASVEMRMFYAFRCSDNHRQRNATKTMCGPRHAGPLVVLQTVENDLHVLVGSDPLPHVLRDFAMDTILYFKADAMKPESGQNIYQAPQAPAFLSMYSSSCFAVFKVHPFSSNLESISVLDFECSQYLA